MGAIWAAGQRKALATGLGLKHLLVTDAHLGVVLGNQRLPRLSPCSDDRPITERPAQLPQPIDIDMDRLPPAPAAEQHLSMPAANDLTRSISWPADFTLSAYCAVLLRVLYHEVVKTKQGRYDMGSGFFKDGDGQLSAMRLGFILWTVGVLVGWFIALLHSNDGTLPTIDQSITYTLGLFITGKVAQSFSPGDQKQPSPPATGQQGGTNGGVG